MYQYGAPNTNEKKSTPGKIFLFLLGCSKLHVAFAHVSSTTDEVVALWQPVSTLIEPLVYAAVIIKIAIRHDAGEYS